MFKFVLLLVRLVCPIIELPLDLPCSDVFPQELNADLFKNTLKPVKQVLEDSGRWLMRSNLQQTPPS